MKANELRIGNYVEYFGKTTQIDGVKRRSNGGFSVEICEKRPSGCSWSEYAPIESPSLNPIPLTEEWLLKFGFKMCDTYDDHHYYLSSIDLGLDRSYQPFGIGEYKLEFKYVHQLQNLYFALTGEELTLKKDTDVKI